MSVRSRIGAEVLGFQFAEGSGTRLLSINGKAVPDPGSMRWAFHTGEPDPVVLLELEVPEDEMLELNIVEHTLRPQEILSTDVFERPEKLAHDITRLSDRALLLTQFAVRRFDRGDAAPFDLRQLLDSITTGNGTGNGMGNEAQAIPGVGGTEAPEPASGAGTGGLLNVFDLRRITNAVGEVRPPG